MLRRNFLTTLGAAGAPFPGSAQLPRGRLKISTVEMWRLEGKREVLRGANRQHQVQPLHIYDELRPKPYRDDPQPVRETVSASALYLKIKTDAGAEGLYGPIDNEAAFVVDRQLRPFLLGKDPLAGDALWDQMFRLNRHSRRGHFMMGISAADNALWDLRGRYYGAPVYRLLGGPTRPAVQAYGSCLGFNVEPEAASRRAIELKAEGFLHQKWFLAYGPGDGAAGLKKNVELVRSLREAVGDEVDLMFDAFMGWDLNFALAWAKQVEPYRPRWIEEAFQPDKVESFAQLRRATSVPVASGEHIYNRWEVNDYLKAGALNVLQTDPEWCGGVSELVRISTVASLYDTHVIPHGHSVQAAVHLVASQPPMTCPLVEYLINSMPGRYVFEKHPLAPVKGRIELPERPGFGIEFDESRIENQTRVSWG